MTAENKTNSGRTTTNAHLTPKNPAPEHFRGSANSTNVRAHRPPNPRRRRPPRDPVPGSPPATVGRPRACRSSVAPPYFREDRRPWPRPKPPRHTSQQALRRAREPGTRRSSGAPPRSGSLTSGRRWPRPAPPPSEPGRACACARACAVARRAATDGDGGRFGVAAARGGVGRRRRALGRARRPER